MASLNANNYPSGFESEVIIRELMRPETTTGQNFYVGNNATLVKGERGESDGNKGTFLSPFSTIDKAINTCQANRGDRIFVRPNHNETIATATALVIDVAGVQVIGLGNGEDRPTLTFATSTAAAIPFSAANYVFANIILVCNIASQNHMGDLTGVAGLFVGCSFREGSATGLSFLTADGSDADIDRTKFIGCDFYAPTAGNMDNAIQLANDFTGVRVIDCEIYGDFDVAGIDVPAGGNAQVDLQIGRCRVTNLLTGQHAISINGTSSTGKIYDTYTATDAFATSVDAGGLEMFNVQFHDGTDQTVSIPVAAEVAGGATLGVRAASTTAVALTGGDVADVFTVTGGPVLVHMLTVEITTVVTANASLIHFESDPTNGASNTQIAEGTAAPDIASAAVGDFFSINGDSQDVMKKAANGTDLPMMENQNGGIVVPAGGIDLKLSTSDPTTGIASIYIVYTPLAAGAFVS